MESIMDFGFRRAALHSKFRIDPCYDCSGCSGHDPACPTLAYENRKYEQAVNDRIAEIKEATPEMKKRWVIYQRNHGWSCAGKCDHRDLIEFDDDYGEPSGFIGCTRERCIFAKPDSKVVFVEQNGDEVQF